jgi:hypothetical protein
MSDPTDPRDEFEGGGDRRRDDGLGEVARAFVRVGAEVLTATTERLRERSEDLRPGQVLQGAANLGVRGKEELVTIAAKEVRGYLEKLQVGKEIRSMLTEHSLEISASVRLKPIVEGTEPEGDDVAVEAGLKKTK